MHFTKLQASGNDFIVVEHQLDIDYSILAIELCHRHYGIGADGLLVLDSKNKKLEIYNADGSIAKMCGNGLRCIGAYLSRVEGECSWDIEVGERRVRVEREHSLYYVYIGMVASMEYIEKQYHDIHIPMYLVDLGARHLVLWNEVSLDHIEALQREYDCNVNIVEVISSKECIVNTYERGVGWTWACGSGACASYYVLKNMCNMEDTMLIHQIGGDVLVRIQEEELVLVGGADYIFEGEYV
ncbi:MAG: diaminopimelate epimerase [Erysipelotrichales bacterium]|nr:diaminopimelate epimerase [Erysipelotrichales bacterium]